jgi:formylglycine-generating enzyme required for sulfatase activity
MGSSAQDSASEEGEKPRHRVTISRPFYMGATEVTVGQFRAFVEATGYQTEAESDGQGGGFYNNKKKDFELSRLYNWRSPGLPLAQVEDEPVVQVSWNDAMAFCGWLSERDRRPYRLPTEAEWEYACRAGSTTRWCMGDDPAGLDDYAWFPDRGRGSTHPVGRKKPNAFGLYDMHGNVWEWCLDWYGPYGEGPVVDPSGAPSGQRRVLRGGTFSRADVDRTRSATRMGRKPSNRFLKYGFRVCCPLATEAGGE